jgi:hypothetical protein
MNQNGNGTGGSGGGPATYDNLGNPDPPQDNDAESQTDKPTRLYVLNDTQHYEEMDHSHEVGTYDGSGITGDNRRTTKDTSNWSDGSNGSESWSLSSHTTITGGGITPVDDTYTGQGNVTWPASSWPTLIGGPEVDVYSDGWTETNAVGPEIGSEHCEVKDPVLPVSAQAGPSEVLDGYCITSTNTFDATYTRHAQTKWKLQTGGRALAHVQGLFQFTATAEELLDKRAVPPFNSAVEREITDKTQIAIGGVGNLQADGTDWKVLPKNANLDTTVIIKGEDFYTFFIGAQEYWLYVAGNSHRLGEATYPKPRFCVGQKVKFSPSWVPSTPLYSHATADWTLPGIFVNRQSSTCDAYYDENSALLHCDSTANSALSTSCWYVDKLQSGSASVAVNLSFANGQQISLNNSGTFDVYKPKADFLPNNDGTPTVIINGNTLSLGTSANHDMGFAHHVQSDFPGVAGYTQLVSGGWQTSPEGIPLIGTELDTTEFPRGKIQLPINPYFFDAPSISLADNLSPTSEDLEFSTYLLFKPSGSGNIFVPLRLVTWELHDSATYNSSSGWTPSGSATDPKDADCTTFPQWTRVYSSGL